MKAGTVCCVLVLALGSLAAREGAGDSPGERPTIAERTANMECQDGFLPLCWDPLGGALLLEVGRLDEPLLYTVSLASGLGSNPLGLDRGSSRSALVRFRRVGRRVLLFQENPSYRAEGGSAALQAGVREQFAPSVLAGWDVEAEEGGRVLVDATEFFQRDALGAAERLRAADEGDYSLDPGRSAFHLPRSRAFPRNTEIEAWLTFAGSRPGPLLRRTVPDARSLTLRVHHSLVALPEVPLEPRRFDPRVGVYPLWFQDYARPLWDRLEQRWIARWRLEHRGGAGRRPARPREPIIYYLDPAMPEPIRGAIREGALWWNEVFEAAGFRDAFRVEDLPDGADPMDARYSIIQWGHRADRGWSWGSVTLDPRTGEILRAVVFMDSHRMRTDHNLWSGLRAGVSDGTACHAGAWGVPDWAADLDPGVSSEEFVLARIRQLAAHEVGHTLGLAHNFAASTYGRASVMDYPAPLLEVVGEELDLSDAYRPGTGEYDELAIRYAYSVFPDGKEEHELARLVQDGLERGMLFLTDADARPIAGSDARAQLWDNRADPLEELRNALAVRRLLLARFDERAIAPGEPLSLLEERLAPVYFHHQFALEAVVKLVGGMEYAYAVRGDGQEPTRPVPEQRQREALALLVETLAPGALALPGDLAASLAPRAYGFGPPTTGEEFGSATWPSFDELGAARTLASRVVSALLHRSRAARLVAFHSRTPSSPGLPEVVGALLDATWRAAAPDDPHQAALHRTAERAVLDTLLELAGDARATVEVRAVAEWALAGLLAELGKEAGGDPMEASLRRLAARDIERFLSRIDPATERSRPLDPPPGSPIGTVP